MKKNLKLFMIGVFLGGIFFWALGNNGVKKIRAVSYEVDLTFGEILPENYDLGSYEASNFFRETEIKSLSSDDLINTTEALGLPEHRLELGKTAGIERTWLAAGEIWVNTNNASGYTLRIGAENVTFDNIAEQKSSQVNPFSPTTCDSQTPCTVDQANIWVNSGSYGAGYQIAGKDKTEDWLTFEYFRPLADLGESEVWPITVAKNFGNLVSDQSVTFNYLIRLDPKTNEGIFSNKIGFYLVPNL